MTSDNLGFTVLYAPGQTETSNDYAKLVLAPDRRRSTSTIITSHADNRQSAFFSHDENPGSISDRIWPEHALRQRAERVDDVDGDFGHLRHAIRGGPATALGQRAPRQTMARWLAYFGMLGAGFMLIEVALLQRFVLLLGHPVYSLTVTLFSVLLGTGVGSLVSRHVSETRCSTFSSSFWDRGRRDSRHRRAAADDRRRHQRQPRKRVALTVLLIAPAGVLMGMPLPAGIRLMTANHSALVPWAWGMNGALSVIGATLAVFIAMNWGFSVTLMTGAAIYLIAAVLLRTSTDNRLVTRAAATASRPPALMRSPSTPLRAATSPRAPRIQMERPAHDACHHERRPREIAPDRRRDVRQRILDKQAARCPQPP